MVMDNNLIFVVSVLFWLTPVALTIHLAVKRTESNAYKKRLGYIYGGLWAIAFLAYGWLFINPANN